VRLRRQASGPDKVRFGAGEPRQTYITPLFFWLSRPLDPLRICRQILPAAEVSAVEKRMRSRFAIRQRPAKRPDFVFAILIVFVILLIGLVRAVDVLTAHVGGTIG
jgi:hypothetical protein